MTDVMRRRQLNGSVAALGALLAAACGATADPSGTTPGAAGRSAESFTLRVNYRSEDYIPVFLARYSEQNPNVKIEPIANSGYEKLQALIAANDVGDMIWGSTSQGSYFQLAWHDHLRPLDPLAKRDKYDLQDMIPKAMETLRQAKDNQLYGIVNEMHTAGVGLFYNTNLFEAAKVAPPNPNWTIDDLTETARKLTLDTDRDGTNNQWGFLGQNSYPWLCCILRSFGGEWLDPAILGKTAAFDRPKAMVAWRWLYDLRHRHRVHPVEGRDKASFLDGNVAMFQSHQSGVAMASQVRDRFTMGLTLMPKGPGGKRGSQAHLGVWSAHSRSKHPDDTWSLIKWMTSKENLIAGPGAYFLPGARISAWNDPQYRAAEPHFEVFRKFGIEEGTELPAIPNNFKVLELDPFPAKAMQPMWEGSQNPEQMVAAVKGEFQALIDQPR